MIAPTAPSTNESEPSISFSPLSAVGTYLRHYELIRKLGGGGMGHVFLARDSKLARLVAIKFLHSQGEELSQRFATEARAIAKCSHENIVTLHEADEYEGIPYLVLEYLAGNTLRKVLEGYPETKPMPPERAVELMVPVIRAVICAHQHNIVHRDLKPGNIIITESGTIKVLDFGIAKVVQPDYLTREQVSPVFDSLPNEISLEDSNLTRQGILIGTLTHMAPEQWAGNENIDFRADLWACGIILFRMLSGKHPLHHLQGIQLQVVSQLDQPMPSLRSMAPQVPEELAQIVDWCLKKRLDERIPDAQTLLQALERFLPGNQAKTLQSDQCPYNGLYAFQENDHNKFFGRSLEIEALLNRLLDQPLVAIVGPSGVGKSSFVRAGLIPALKRADSWESIVFRPGSNPLLALARSIGEPESEKLEKEIVARMRAEPGWAGVVLRNRAKFNKKRIVLFVDQFEELYTLTNDQKERESFLNCLGGIADHASSPIRVIISLRSDFVDRIFQEPKFSKEWGQGLFFLRSPQGKNLEEALVKPLEMAGYGFENETIISEMLEYLRNTPGALPLLQFVARQLWEGRDRNRKLVTMQSYQELGGISGALAQYADRVLETLAPVLRDSARILFLRLVTPEKTRAVVSLKEIQALSQGRAELEHLVEKLVQARLLIVQEGSSGSPGSIGSTIELVHESLIDNWPQLKKWLEETGEDSFVLEQLRIVSKQWKARNKDQNLLWQGDLVSEAKRLQKRFQGELSKLENEYLEAVFAQASRAARRKSALIVTVIVFLSVLTAALAGVAVVIKQAKEEADRQAQIARIAEARALKSLEEAQQKEQERAEAARHAEEEQKRAEAAAQSAQRALEKENAAQQEALRKAREARSAQEAAVRAEQERIRLREKELERLKRQQKQMGGAPIIEKELQ